MTKTILYPNQQFGIIDTNLDERLPAITSGLIAYYPMDGSTNGIDPYGNIIDSANHWINNSSGNQGIYIVNGDDNNYIIHYKNPFGNMSHMWTIQGGDVDSDSDGGWNIENQNIDSTKTYRFSVWIRREDSSLGTLYFGCQPNTVWNLGTTTVNSNPYFRYALDSEMTEQSSNWLLWVGFIHASTYNGSTSSNSGVYMLDGTKVTGGSTQIDFKWITNQTSSGHRAYLDYSTATDNKIYWFDPRMEIYDGSTSSTINEMLAGSPDLLHPTIVSGVYLHAEERIGIINHPINNDIVNPSGDISAGIPGDYTPGWDSSLHPTASTVNTWSSGYNTNVSSHTIGYHAQWVPEGRDGSWCMKMIDQNELLYGLGHRSLEINQDIGTMISQSWTVEQFLEVSWDQKVDNIDKISKVGIYHYEGVINGFFDAIVNKSNTVINRWERKSITFDTSGWVDSSVNYLYFYGNSGDYGTIWYDNIQLYNVNNITYPNSIKAPFVDGDSVVSTNITIPIKEKPDVYTVVGKFMPYTPFADTTYNESTPNQSVLFRIQDDRSDWTGNMYYKYYINTTSQPFLDADGSMGSSQTYQTYTIDASDNLANEITYAITKTGTTFNTKLYQHSEWKSTHTNTLAYNTELSNFIIGSSINWNGTHRNIAIYNKVLTDNELNIAATSIITLDNSTFRTTIDENINYNIWPNPNLDISTYTVNSDANPTLVTDVSEGTYHTLTLSSDTYHYKGYDISTNLPLISADNSIYIPFSENKGTSVLDIRGNYIGILSNSINWINGKRGSGVKSIISTINPSPYDIQFPDMDISVPLTYSFWIRQNTNWNIGGNTYLFCTSQGGTSSYYGGVNIQLRGDPARLAILLGDNVGVDPANRMSHYYPHPLTSRSATEWVHVIITQSSTNTALANTKVYYNTLLQTTSEISSGTNATIICPSTNIEPRFFSGPGSPISTNPHVPAAFSIYIDEFAVWNRVLTTSEISHLYNNGIGLFNIALTKKYVFSGWFWVSAGHSLTNKPLVIEQATTVLGYKYNNWSDMPEEEWVYAHATCIADKQARFLIYPCTSTAGSGTIRWRNIVVRKANEQDLRLNEDILQIGELI